MNRILQDAAMMRPRHHVGIDSVCRILLCELDVDTSMRVRKHVLEGFGAVFGMSRERLLAKFTHG